MLNFCHTAKSKPTLRFHTSTNRKLEYAKKYYVEHREKILRYQRQYVQMIPENWEHRLEYMRQYRKLNPERVKTWNAKSRQNNKEFELERGILLRHLEKKTVMDHYSNGTGKCACCGTDRSLCLDHIKPILRSKNGAKKTDYRKIIKDNFPEGYQVLCFDCNNSKGRYDKCKLIHFSSQFQ